MKFKKIFLYIVFFILLLVIFLIQKRVKVAFLTINRTNTYKVVTTLRFNMKLFQEKCYLDQNKNNLGEYPSFSLLKSKKMLPKDLQLIKPNILKAHGYYYTLYLPKDITNQENFFIVYVWPAEYGVTGDFIMHVNQTNTKLSGKLKNSGIKQIPNIDAAYIKQGKNFKFSGKVKKDWSVLSK
ncbi:hypothetical protein [Candidatus Uabimicrobium sp. HlEnr_7]|uniref:hypothetical protein n=1 Tax=Candidatus Uabimicrobium helgolandensis TaxID=3095367 RepID=UPI003556F1E6